MSRRKNKQERLLRALERERRAELAPANAIATLRAEDAEALEAQRASYDRADSWAHSAPGTPYGGTEAE